MSKPKPINPIDKPTRRTIETLFRDMLRDYYRDDADPLHTKYRQCVEEEDVLEKKLLDNPKLKALKRKREKAYSEYYTAKTKLKQEVQRVQQLYLAKGLTKEVLEAIDKLVSK